MPEFGERIANLVRKIDIIVSLSIDVQYRGFHSFLVVEVGYFGETYLSLSRGNGIHKDG